MSEVSGIMANQGLRRVQMRVITAVVVVFTLCCSGSFGMEDVVSSSGPGATILMILVLPLLWSLPLALVSSELTGMVPEAGGLYRWIRRAMGEYWSFQGGWWWTLSLYVDSAVYVALALDYLQNHYDFGGSERALIGIAIVALFTFINIRGLDLTGWSLWVIEIVTMVPFVIFTILGIAKGTGSAIHPFVPEGESFKEAMQLGLAIMLWMYSGWESIGTLSGEIENPQRVIPRALFIGLPLVIGTYLLTVIAGIMGAGAGQWANMWTGGGGLDFVEIGKILGGNTLAYLMLISAIFSNIGLYAGYLATGARPSFQMSRDRLFPKFYGLTHKSWGTPWVAILIMGVVDGVLVQFHFDTLITIDVFLLMFAYILIYLACIVLRYKEPNTERPFRVPLPNWGLIAMCAVPIAIAVISLFINGTDWMIGGLFGIMTGPIAYLVFKSIYKGTKDEALEGAAITPEGEHTELFAQMEA